MPSEMRRPATIDVNDFVAALDTRLRAEVGRTRRWAIPEQLRHPICALRIIAKPMIQSGSMVLTALAVIIAIGATPTNVTRPAEFSSPLAAPSLSADLASDSVQVINLLPADDVLAVQVPDNSDTPPLTVE